MSHKPASVATLSEQELDEIRTLIERHSGILLDASRERFFASRVREHMQDRHLAAVADLMLMIRSSNVEYDLLLERLLTQETSFFRYPAVFEAFGKRVLPEMHAKKFWENPRKLRIWSAACSTGEEAYSIAISVADALVFAEAWNIEILATDISRQALRQAARGVYQRRSLANLTPQQIQTHFTQSGETFTVKPRVRNLVSFAPMNLAQAVYVGRMDCIFCMNVLMYFSEERRNSLVQRFYDYLEPGGYLFLGHAESIAKVPVRFESIVVGDCMLYRKPSGASARRTAAVVEGRS